MKKLLFVFAVMFTIVACTGNKTEVVLEDNDSIEIEDTLVDSMSVDTIAQISE